MAERPISGPPVSGQWAPDPPGLAQSDLNGRVAPRSDHDRRAPGLTNAKRPRWESRVPRFAVRRRHAVEPSLPAGGTRILLVTNNLPPVRGGSGIVYDNLARHAGGRIVVIAPKVSYQDGLSLIGWREHDRLAPYRVVRLGLLRTVMHASDPGWSGRLRLHLHDAAIRVRLLATVARCLLRQPVTAVCIGELVASAWLLSILRLFPSVTRAVYVHGEEITTHDDYDTTQERRRRALLMAHHVVVVSRFTANAVAELLGDAGVGRIRLIENGVDVARFRPVPRPPGLVALNGLTGCFVFVSVCRLLEKKGIDQAIRAFAQVAEQYPDSRYLVVGEGPYRAALEALAMAEGVADKVRFTGAVADDELVEHYALGDVFVMPNRRLANGDTEGFGLVFLEANACGLPVIAGSDGGSIDAVLHGVNGLLVDGHSVASIVDAMMELRRDKALCERLRAGGHEAAAAADWRHKTQAFLAMFDARK
jgi:phosphatidyl-myo-inositol dimannoside synthase